MPGVWLQVEPSGAWHMNTEVTDRAAELLDLYLPLQVSPCFVIGQLGQSLDGHIATVSGNSHFVTGEEDILRLHRLRALVDAVVVGVNTVEQDNPRLTVRLVEGDDPVRVVLDPKGRVRADRALFTGGPRTIVIRAGASEGNSGSEGTTAHVEEITLSAGVRGFDPRQVVKTLGELGLCRILVEGGGVTVSHFLEAGVLDRLHVTVAPMLIGSGRRALTLPPVDTLDEALRPACRIFHLGADVLFDLDLRGGSAPSKQAGQEHRKAR